MKICDVCKSGPEKVGTFKIEFIQTHDTTMDAMYGTVPTGFPNGTLDLCSTCNKRIRRAIMAALDPRQV